MNEAVNTWNEKHPEQLLVLNRYENTYVLSLYNLGESGLEKEFEIIRNSFKLAWDTFIERTEG